MAKRKTQIDKAIADMDSKIAAVEIEREQIHRQYMAKQGALQLCRDVLLATKAAHATLKTPKIVKADDHVAKRTA